MHSVTHLVLLSVVALLTQRLYVLWSAATAAATAAKRVSSSRPPGPRLLPLIGRIHDLPIEYMWLKFKEWADTYGPLYYTEMLGTAFVIVSDERIAEDLLVKRAKVLSDRPAIRSIVDSKSEAGSMEYLPLMGKNKYWARQRRLQHAYLTEASNAQYHGIMGLETRHWLVRLLESPDDFAFSLEDMAARIMCHLTWANPDHSTKLTPSAWGLLTQMSPAGPITNVLTPLWNLPFHLNPWKMAEKKRHDKQQAWWMERYLEVKMAHSQNQAYPSWTSQYLDKAGSKGLSGDLEASNSLGMLALVGVFTIAGPLYYFLLAMIVHPEWQRKIQLEIDHQCKGELPKLDDYANMPILRACIKETMRWRPNVPTGVAHEAEQDLWYDGYLIKRGTRVLPLDWAFLRNPTKYPDPENYRPERWLDHGWPTYQEPLSKHPSIKGFTSFGWGQRACLGQTLTQDETFVACGALLWGFTLSRKIDAETGREVPVSLTKSNSLLIIKPDPFEMAFQPREGKAEKIVREWKEAREAHDARRALFRSGAVDKL